MTTATNLDGIVSRAQQRLEARKVATPLAKVVALARRQPYTRDLARALRGPRLNLIAEVKRASPSKGPLKPDLDPAALAAEYAKAGAAAISVLTEEDHFGGSLADLASVRSAVDVPLLRKDFVVDPYQVWEARAHGADAVLLIVAVLTDDELKRLLSECQRAALSALVEVHDELELERALKAGATIVGINNRDLRDFTVSLDTTRRLRPMVPDGVVVVSESGIRSRADVEILEALGVQAMLVGEALVTASQPGRKIKELLGIW